ncbi:uncharacterized protein N7498_003014 [Penicillium cinerascens]|uniref:Uncharacterized protein n=1 Tax=Penicillium cinerascens TaxID=70096 RepID=A0A9W9NB57_9EURO|nr:uncharacterized protein N7498_003014 [Penicillium cinerascens]KAJ5216607.1 hypothetical protein N7498_003014 [Penicillium cinerascens]
MGMQGDGIPGEEPETFTFKPEGRSRAQTSEADALLQGSTSAPSQATQLMMTVAENSVRGG